MRTYLANLRSASIAANLLCEQAKIQAHHAHPRIVCDTPLIEQIDALMRSLPPVQRDRPWSMEELVARLQGRYSSYSSRPHAMHVGQALRALGWTQKRDWTRDGSGRRYWHK